MTPHLATESSWPAVRPCNRQSGDRDNAVDADRANYSRCHLPPQYCLIRGLSDCRMAEELNQARRILTRPEFMNPRRAQE